MAGHVKKLESGRWQARFPVGGGRYRSKNFDRKGDADRWLRAQADARDRGGWVDPKKGRTPFSEVADEWAAMRGHLAESTTSRDESYLRSLILPTFGHVPVAGIDTEQIEGWIRSMNRSPATVHKAFQILSGVLDRAVRTRRITANPAKLAEGLPRVERSEMRFLTRDEVGKLAVESSPHETLIWMAALTGMRWAELVGLRWENLNLETRTATVAETIVEVNGRLVSKPPKTPASRRTITLPSTVSRMLEGDAEDDLVFAGPLRRSNFRNRVWEPATKATGLTGVRFHDLRHTHAAWLIAERVHPKVISSRLGHASITVTMDRYGHLMDGLDAEAAELLDQAIET